MAKIGQKKSNGNGNHKQKSDKCLIKVVYLEEIEKKNWCSDGFRALPNKRNAFNARANVTLYVTIMAHC